MANIEDLDFSAGAIPDPETQPRGTVADYAKTFGAGALGIGGDLASAARFAFDLGQSPNAAKMAQGISQMFGAGEDAINDTINPETRKLAAAGLTSPEFLAHPIQALGLKGTGMLPAVLAVALPGGLLADTVAAARAAVGVSGGAINSGTGLKEFYKQLDEKSDSELQDDSPKYKALREVMDEGPARKRFTQEAQGWAPLINFIIGAGVSEIGPAGTAAAKLAGGTSNVVGAAGRGAIGAGVISGAEGAAGGALQSTVSDITGQQANIEASFQKDFDLAKTLNAGLEGGALGGIAGALTGALLHGKTPPPKTMDRITKVLDIADESPAAPAKNEAIPQPKTGATGVAAKPVETPEVGNVQNEPTRGSRNGAKKKIASTDMPAVDAQGPDAAMAAAIKATGDSEPATATELAAIKPEVTPPGNAPPEVARASVNLDTGQNVPEQPAILAAQADQVGTASRKAVMYPIGTKEPKVPEGLDRVRTPRGVFHFDPTQTSTREIKKLSALGRENEILGLGPVSKPEAVAGVARGETPVAVTERTKGGLEVKAAAGTDITAPVQAKALEEKKTPGNVVAVETPENVTQMRTGRVLPNLTQTAETVPLSDFNKNKVLEPKPKGKHYTKTDRANQTDMYAAAKEIVDKHVGDDALEREHLTDPKAREVLIERARAMLAEAKERNVKVLQKIELTEKGDSSSDNPAMQILVHAKDLIKAADKKGNKEGQERTKAANRFWERDRSTRKGYSKEVVNERKAEAETATRVAQGTGEEGPAKVKIFNKESEGAASEVRSRKDLIDEMNAKLGLTPKKAKPEVIQQAHGPSDVNRNPTPAQMEAGNYGKWHKRVEGIDMAVENPKGAIRRSKPSSETPWEVKMPADYGYIKRTNGADGDHIDAYDGRTGSRNFVIDQLDHRTGQFDEHKVMLRFKDEAAARDAYERAFSDGKGAERLGHIHEVTKEELHAWLDQGNTQEPHVNHLVRNFENVNFGSLDARRDTRKLVKVLGGDEVKVLRSSTAGAELDKIDFSKVPGIAGVLGKHFQNVLIRVGEDIEVHFVTPEVMKTVSAKGTPDAGLHIHGVDPRVKSQIFISNMNDGTGYYSRAHTLLHEVAHAVTVREIDSLVGAKSQIEQLAKHAKDYLEKHWDEHQLEFGNKLDYGFTNYKEFIAEAFSNPHFQEFLSRVPIDKDLARYLGLREIPRTAWDAVRGYAKRALEASYEKLTGKKISLNSFDSALDGIMKVGERLTDTHVATGRPSVSRARALQEAHSPERYAERGAVQMEQQAADVVRRALEHPALQTSERAPWILKLRTFDNIAKIADHYFGGADSNPIRKIHDGIERMRVYGEKFFEQFDPTVRKAVALRSADPAGFREYESLQHDSTLANLHPDVPLSDAKNQHLGDKRVVGNSVWQKAQHPELAKRFNELSEPLKKLWHEQGKMYADTQNKMSLGIINNMVKLFGIKDNTLGKRIHEGTLDDADRAALGDHLETIEKAKELSKIEGYYVPLIRRGDHVVKGEYNVTRPGNAKEISSNEFEFASRKEAEDYASKSELQVTIKKVWVDEKTGEIHQADPNTGEPHKMLATDIDAKPVYRAEVNNKHVEYVQGRTAAFKRHAELAADPNMTMHIPVPRAFEPGGRQASELSAALSGLLSKLQKSEAYKQSTPTQQAGLRQAIQEAAAASHGSTRISSKALPRRNVKGASEDSIQGMVDYGESAGRYLAKLEHMPAVEAGMKEMEEGLKSDHSKVNQYGRTAIRNEVVKRVQGDVGFEQGGKFAGFVKRAMAISFIDKLASPAYSVVNATQVAMLTMPYLSGTHGIARTVSALGRAYSDVSALRVVGQGIRETGRRLKGDAAPDNYIEDIKARVKSPGERDLMDHLVESGRVDPNGGMEIKDLVKNISGALGKVDNVIGYLDGVTRAMPRAIEAINRTVTGLAAYRLEISRGATHEAAMRYAGDAIDSTQFNYSSTNAPKLFNHPMAKMAFQFKKYGQGMYQLMGMQVGKALRNASPGDRAEAIKTLTMLAGTHMAAAGALGLPTEPFKYLLMGASAVGLPVGTWSDVEDKIRKASADVLGKTGGEVFSRGLPRLLNLDLSRLGADSVTSFGEPRSHKDSDVKSWLFDSLAGPVASLGGDWIKGINQIGNGEFEKAAENLVPMKAISDSLRAYRQATEGKKSASGRETMSAYTPGETAARMLGFGSGREAEIGASNSAFYRKSTAAKEERAALVNKWAQAESSSKTSAMAAITKWNQSQAEENRIKPKDLTAKLKADEKAKSKAVHGVVANRRDKRFLAEGEIYNTR